MSGFLARPGKIMVTGDAGFLGSRLCDAPMRASHVLEEGLANTIDYFQQLLALS